MLRKSVSFGLIATAVSVRFHREMCCLLATLRSRFNFISARVRVALKLIYHQYLFQHNFVPIAETIYAKRIVRDCHSKLVFVSIFVFPWVFIVRFVRYAFISIFYWSNSLIIYFVFVLAAWRFMQWMRKKNRVSIEATAIIIMNYIFGICWWNRNCRVIIGEVMWNRDDNFCILWYMRDAQWRPT